MDLRSVSAYCADNKTIFLVFLPNRNYLGPFSHAKSSFTCHTFNKGISQWNRNDIRTFFKSQTGQFTWACIFVTLDFPHLSMHHAWFSDSWQNRLAEFRYRCKVSYWSTVGLPLFKINIIFLISASLPGVRSPTHTAEIKITQNCTDI